MAKKSEIAEVKAALSKKTPPEGPIRNKDLLSSGSTLLNLACSGRAIGAFKKKHFYFLVGDSRSGKTFLTLTCFAEACQRKSFQNYKLIYNNVEDGALMNKEQFFGKTAAEKMEVRQITTIQEFYYDLDDEIKKGKPFVYVLDSMDALDSLAADKKFQENKAAHKAGKAAKGSYGDGKAAVNSQNIRKTLDGLAKTDSILIVISQTRDNIDAGMFENPKTRSGGHALTFYATLEMWSSVGKKIKRTVKGKDIAVGAIMRIKVTKNRLTGKERTIEIPIYNSVGLDDTESCINYLLEMGRIKSTNGVLKLALNEQWYRGSKDDLIKQIEDGDLMPTLRAVVQEVWDDVEAKLTVVRKPRYG